MATPPVKASAQPSPTPSSATATAPASASARPDPTATATAAATVWSELTAPGPSAREDHTWTVDPAGEVAYLFGGRSGSDVYADLWAFDLASDTWEPVDARGPEPRFGHEAVWAEGVGLVVFAGQAGATFYNDLWAYRPGEGWTQLPASGAAPKERYGSCSAIGPDGRLWISHAFTSEGTRFADTLAYDFTTNRWTDETPDGDRPVSRCLHGCWWTDDGSFALYAGQTTGITSLGDRWLLTASVWRKLDGRLPPDRNLFAHARVSGATVVVGGQGLDGAFRADTWILRDGVLDAQLVETTGSAPPGRSGATMVLDERGGRLLLFGGRDDAGARGDMWELSGPVG